MAPAGRPEDVPPFFLPANIGACHILEDILPFMKDHRYRCFPLYIGSKAIFDRLVFLSGQFGLESAKQLVPDDQEHAYVLVEMLGRSKHGVPGGGEEGYQYMFQPAHFPDQFGMYKNAPYLGG